MATVGLSPMLLERLCEVCDATDQDPTVYIERAVESALHLDLDAQDGVAPRVEAWPDAEWYAWCTRLASILGASSVPVSMRQPGSADALRTRLIERAITLSTALATERERARADVQRLDRVLGSDGPTSVVGTIEGTES